MCWVYARTTTVALKGSITPFEWRQPFCTHLGHRPSPLRGFIHGRCGREPKCWHGYRLRELYHLSSRRIAAGTHHPQSREELFRASIHLTSVSSIVESFGSLGYLDSPADQPFRQLDWNDVNTEEAQELAYQAAVEGVVLLKDDSILPLDGSTTKVAIIGPWANATVQMQGKSSGPAPFLISPYQDAQNAGYETTCALGTGINSTSDSGFAEALTFFSTQAGSTTPSRWENR